jgi:hypothetical protein
VSEKSAPERKINKKKRLRSKKNYATGRIAADRQLTSKSSADQLALDLERGFAKKNKKKKKKKKKNKTKNRTTKPNQTQSFHFKVLSP